MGYNDEVSMSSGKKQDESAGLNSTANERFNTAAPNPTSRKTNKKKPSGPFGGRGMPK